MARAKVYKRIRTAAQGDVEVVVRKAKPLRAKFVFPAGFTVKDKDGNYTTLQNSPSDSVYSFDFPFGPKDLKYDQFSPSFQELNRPFKKPLLVASGESLRTLTFNAVIANVESGGKLSIVDVLDSLEAIAESGAAFQFTYGLVALPFQVVLTKFSYDVSYRNLEGAPIRAEVSVQLTESVFLNQDLIVLKAVYRQPIVTAQISPPAPPSVKDQPDRPTLSTVDPNGNNKVNVHDGIYDNIPNLPTGFPT